MITIIGPTASGKTRLAANIAYQINSEIISADSRQVYRGMDIGTGKDLNDYIIDGKQIPYHLIDILPAGAKYNLCKFQRDFHTAYNGILSRGIGQPILCGGTGLYVESVLRGYNLPDVPCNKVLREELEHLSNEELKNKLESYQSLHNTTDLDSRQRTIRAIEIADYIAKELQVNKSAEVYDAVESLVICLNLTREERRKRISDRLAKRVKEGLFSEVQGLLSSGVKTEELIYYGLEYKFVTLYILGEISKNKMLERLEIAIHQFAKRQMTWFRGMERRGINIEYIDAALPLNKQLELSISLIDKYNSKKIV